MHLPYSPTHPKTIAYWRCELVDWRRHDTSPLPAQSVMGPDSSRIIAGSLAPWLEQSFSRWVGQAAGRLVGASAQSIGRAADGVARRTDTPGVQGADNVGNPCIAWVGIPRSPSAAGAREPPMLGLGGG